MLDTGKLHFITNDFIALIKNADATVDAQWGKMNFQQMVEHVTDFFKVSSNKIQMPLVTPVEHLPKYREFLLSDKVFRENTKAPASVLSEEPLPIRNAELSVAISKLEKQVNDFVTYFQDNAGAKTSHPVFGELDFEDWILLHYKHVTHHARQFGLM
jgi:hypothetical protein